MDEEKELIRAFSERLVEAQIPIRILDSIKWTDDIKKDFFAHKCQRLPKVDKSYYQNQPLNFDPKLKLDEFKAIIRDTKNKLGAYSVISQLIEHRCIDYMKAVDLLVARGTPQFSQLSKELYGNPDDVFYLGGPKLSGLGTLLGGILENIIIDIKSDKDKKIYSAQQALEILQKRLSHFFNQDDQVVVELSDTIVADAAAGADKIKLNRDVFFSERDLNYLEVHEGWVHVGTTLNGRKQSCCTFLAKGSPASTVTQEGLAVITEIFTFSSYPARLLRLTNRVSAIDMANNGAHFLEVYRFFLEQGYSEDDSYNFSTRIFRGSTPECGPFTKDLAYMKGFVLIYNYIRLAVKKRVINTVPLLFAGKVLLEELKYITGLVNQGIIEQPTYLPPQFSDLAALSSWMSLSLYLNQFDLDKLADQYTFI